MAASDNHQEHVLPPGTHSDQVAEDGKVIADGASESSSNINPPESLKKFQTIVGIETPDEITKPRQDSKSKKGFFKIFNFNQPPANKGIYQNVVDLQGNRRMGYVFCTILINTCLLAQIAFAAILTALGAAEAPHSVITVFGAINVGIAGVLALLKGQGLPDRLRKDWMGLTKVRNYIEERERLLEQQVVLEYETKDKDGNIFLTKEVLKKEIQAVLDMYESQLATMEANKPDSYVFPGEGQATGKPLQYNLG